MGVVEINNKSGNRNEIYNKEQTDATTKGAGIVLGEEAEAEAGGARNSGHTTYVLRITQQG